MQAQCSAITAPGEVFSDGQSGGDGVEDKGNNSRGQCEMGTLTELHNSSNMPEVELFSLLEEKIPMYKLRADTTSTLTYEHSDWLRSSSMVGLEEDPCELLSPVMMEETLKYFTLCGDRVVQMTRTYNDIDAVTRLLEEKEKDLELAAKIGQSLLEQNKQLEKRIDTIEEQFTLAADQNTQLKHDMKLKEQLLRIYTNEVSYSDSEEEASQSHERSHLVQSKFINVEALQKKVRILEEENFHLRMETAEMKTETVSIEEKEVQLVQDAFKQLGEAQGREGVLTEELRNRLEETYQQKEEITYLLAQIVDLQQKVKKLSIENEELQHQYRAAREAQQSLTKELQETKDKSDEYVTMLNEARSEVKAIHRRSLPKGNLPSYSLTPLPVFPPDSLAAELVDSMEQEMTGGVPKSSRRINKKEQNKNIMRTVKDLNKATSSRAPSEYSSDVFNNSRRTSPGSSVLSLAGSNRCDTPLTEQYEGDNESNNSPSGSVHQMGRAGIPGSNDLETALRRLNLRKENEDAEQKYAEEEKRRLLHGPADGTEGSHTPTCPTPGSLWSTESFAGLPSMSGQVFRSYMPEKLQIVKPMEGSLTLYHWQRLAQPHMASMLDVRPGVMVKGFRELDRDPAIYSMDDVEDDGRVIERTCVPSKCFVSTSSTYTYTTSTIGLLDSTQLTSSTQGPRMANTEHVSKAPKPVAAKTFSTSLGLAQVLKERGVDEAGEPKVLTKVEAAAINPAGVNAGLNMFGAAPPYPSPKSTSEAWREAELEQEPRGMHRVSSRIFSRFAVPVRSKNITDALDPETKARLMEKVRKIRAEKETSERRARTLQRQPSIPSVRTRDVVMSPVRTPKPPASGLAAESPHMGLEGAIGGYSPPGAYGSHSGTVHRNTGLSPGLGDSKLPKKLITSDDSGIELGFGSPSPAPITAVSNAPFQMSFMGTVSTTRSVPGFNTVLSSSRPFGALGKDCAPHSVMYSSQQSSQQIGILGALSTTDTVSSNPKMYVPHSMSFASSVSSNPKQQVPRSVGQASSALTHGKPPSGKDPSMSAGSSFPSQLSGQQGLASLTSSSPSASTRPRSSVVPLTNLKSSLSTRPQGPGVGLESLLGASRPSVLPVGEHKEGSPSGPDQGTTQSVTSPMSVFVSSLSSVKGFGKQGPVL